MYSISSSYSAKQKRAADDFGRGEKALAREDGFYIFRLQKDLERPPKRAPAEMLFFDFSVGSDTSEKPEFCPSSGVTTLVRRAIKDARQRQSSVVEQWLSSSTKKYPKAWGSGTGVGKKDFYEENSARALNDTRGWITKRIGHFIDGIGSSALAKGLDSYRLTEAGKLRPEIVQLISTRLGVSSDDGQFVSLLRDDLWRAGLDGTIGGAWGRLSIASGELVVDVSRRPRAHTATEIRQ
jgi:hypothetical protein